MNVRITETVALEDVPAKVSKMVDETKHLLIEDLFTFDLIRHGIAGQMSSNQDLKFMLAEIDKIRKNLAKADAKLEDCAGIIRDFETIVSSAQEENESDDALKVIENNDSSTVETKEEEKNDCQID